MKQKLQITLLCLAFVGLSLWSSWPKGEPSWGGKTVSEWLVELELAEGYSLPHGVSEAEWERQGEDRLRRRRAAEQAFRNLGTSALDPILASLKEARRMPDWIKKLATKLGMKLPEPPSQGLLALRAYLALEALGDSARGAVPALTRMLQDTNTFGTAAQCLSATGTPGALALANCLSVTNENQRFISVVYLATMGTNAAVALPAVEAAVNDLDPKVARRAVSAYARIEPDKLRLIRTLQHWTRIKSASPLTLTGAMGIVGGLHRPHGTEVEVLITALLEFAEDNDEKVRASALTALAKFGSLAAPARQHGLVAIQSESREMRISGCQLLAALRLEPEVTVPLLVNLAQDDPDEYVRTAALHAAATFGEAGLRFCGPLRTQVERAIQEREEHERLWQRNRPK